MKKMLVAVACVALASCNKSEPAPAPVETAAPASTAATGAPTGDVAGTYEVTMADGTVVMETMNADGTYVDKTKGAETERGRWRVNGDKTCFDPDGDKPEACYGSSAPGPDGSFAVTDATGKDTGTKVRKVAAAPAAAPAQ